MHGAELFLIFLLVICVVAYLARRIKIATPIAFVLAGMALALVPGLPTFQIPPDLILLLFLPPLLTEAAYFTSLRDFKANLRPILQLAIGLVVATCIVTAYLLNWLVPGIGLAAGFVLGAIISPPDAVAAFSMTREVKIPRRLMIILEGESLVNDATGLVLYKFAVAAVVLGTFSLQEASLHFVWMVVSGLGIGWLLGWTYMRLFPHIKEMSVEILSTFLVPYISYILVESLHGSGVLAVVITGLTVGWYAPQRFTPAFRVPAKAVWDMVSFVLNGIVFLLIGLHFPGLLARLHNYPTAGLVSLAGAISGAAIAVRFVWVYTLAYGVRYVFAGIRRKDPYPTWENVFIIAWTGMRGVVSLATALALPLILADGSPFIHRDLIIFLAFSVILVTLVLQGISLPWLVKKLSLTYEMIGLYEKWRAQKEAAENAMQKLNELRKDQSVNSAAFDRILSHYRDRLESLGDGPNTPLTLHEPPSAENHPLIQMENRIWETVLDAEREAVICLRQTFKISDEVMHEILRDIDLLHNRFANNP
jgi:monovalent cation/hydrogen antiporter